jgi:peptide deformylase
MAAKLECHTEFTPKFFKFQADHGWGRAIAASQIGEHRRIVCMRVDKEIAMINPVISHHSKERITVWEDCMSFPDLLVKLSNPRHQYLKDCYLIFLAFWSAPD